MPPAGARNYRTQAFCPCCIRLGGVAAVSVVLLLHAGRSAICSLDVRPMSVVGHARLSATFNRAQTQASL